MSAHQPTAFPDLNLVLTDLVRSAQSILQTNFVAAYLQGSFALGAGDRDSDVDWLIVIREDLSDQELAALQAMHHRIFASPSPWAQHLEGSYFPQDVLRQADPVKRPLYYLDNGSQELIRSAHDNELVVRWVTREHGITLAGPEAARLIEPVPATDLRQEVIETIHQWGDEILSGAYNINNRWAQPFAVISYCRMLHTLDTDRIDSKPAGVQWAKANLAHRWLPLIESAWAERPNPTTRVTEVADAADVQRTLDFIREIRREIHA